MHGCFKRPSVLLGFPHFEAGQVLDNNPPPVREIQAGLDEVDLVLRDEPVVDGALDLVQIANTGDTLRRMQ